MTTKHFKKITEPRLEKQTLYQLTQMKSFIDTRLKECLSKNFDTDSEKIQYLLNVLYDIRDFVLSQTIENSVRISLLSQFEQIENQIKVGNDQKNLESESLEKVEEKLESDQSPLETSEEEEIESTTDS